MNATTEYATINNYLLFENIAQEHYRSYLEINDELNEIGGNDSWDLFSHTQEENNNYTQLWSVKLRTAIIAVVFEAFAMEAFLNDFVFKKFGVNDIQKLKEKGDNKSDLYCRIINKAYHVDLDKNDETVLLIKDLFITRNSLAHNRTISLYMGMKETAEEALEDLQDFVNGMSASYGDALSVIKSVINTFTKATCMINNFENPDPKV